MCIRDRIRSLCDVEGAEINKAKQRLAFEVTKLVHGEEEAQKAAKAAEALFNGGVDLENVPTIELSEDKLGTSLIDLLVEFKVLPSKSEARRLLQQNGLSLNNEKVTDISATLNKEHFAEGFAMIKKGKKGFTKVVIK